MHPKYSYFSRAATVSRKGHKFLAFGLEIAQPFLNTVPAPKNLEKKKLTLGKTFLMTN